MEARTWALVLSDTMLMACRCVLLFASVPPTCNARRATQFNFDLIHSLR